MLVKICTKCKIEKTVDCFSKAKLGKYGVKSECKTCVSEYRKANKDIIRKNKIDYYVRNKDAVSKKSSEYYQANKTRLNEKSRQYQQANKEEIAKKRHQYYMDNIEYFKFKYAEYVQKNKDRVSEYGKQYRINRVEKIAAYAKQYKKLNRAVMNAHHACRKATKLQATPLWADNKAISGLYKLASLFNKIGINLHVDHIVPLQSDVVCGLHCEANLQLLPASDNISKGNRWWPDMW